MSKLANWFASHQLGFLNLFFAIWIIDSLSLQRPIREEDNQVFNFFLIFGRQVIYISYMRGPDDLTFFILSYTLSFNTV